VLDLAIYLFKLAVHLTLVGDVRTLTYSIRSLSEEVPVAGNEFLNIAAPPAPFTRPHARRPPFPMRMIACPSLVAQIRAQREGEETLAQSAAAASAAAPCDSSIWHHQARSQQLACTYVPDTLTVALCPGLERITWGRYPHGRPCGATPSSTAMGADTPPLAGCGGESQSLAASLRAPAEAPQTAEKVTEEKCDGRS
jgi:hypothetical protein